MMKLLTYLFCLAFGLLAIGPASAFSLMGATNPVVTQENLKQTVCLSGWSDTQRPPTYITNSKKRYQLPPGTDISKYEGDHILPISIGGNPNGKETDPNNIWAQPWGGVCGAHAKDKEEWKTHRELCSGKITLKEAQARFMPWVCEEEDMSNRI